QAGACAGTVVGAVNMMKSSMKMVLAVAVLLLLAAGAVVWVVINRSQQSIAAMQTPLATLTSIDPDPPQPLIANFDDPATTSPSTQPTGPVVRCAVINGMNITGFWKAVTDRFTAETGIRVLTVTFGEKATIDGSFRKGGIDLLTMHACDKIINLVADGLAQDPQPWARNDLILVGPAADPAHIRGLSDAAEALRRIAATKSPLVVHASLGAQEVLRGVVAEAQVQFDPATVTQLFDDPGREVLKIAAQKSAYTLIGRIPFRMGRLPNQGLEIMVQADPRLRRPYVVVVANPANISGARLEPAQKLSAYLSSPKTQAWIATWGIGNIDDRPVFFPVQPKAH
ncbi:MAG: tungstate transporter permease, partial [Phycisphaerales bacterium]|nr:tungstate transporter permease [Phycisphaerales bacterium]